MMKRLLLFLLPVGFAFADIPSPDEQLNVATKTFGTALTTGITILFFGVLIAILVFSLYQGYQDMQVAKREQSGSPALAFAKGFSVFAFVSLMIFGIIVWVLNMVSGGNIFNIVTRTVQRFLGG